MDSRFVDYDGKSVYDEITKIKKNGSQGIELKRIKVIINDSTNPVELQSGVNRVTIPLGDEYDYNKCIGVTNVVPQSNDFGIVGYGLTQQGIFLVITSPVVRKFIGLVEVVQLN